MKRVLGVILLIMSIFTLKNVVVVSASETKNDNYVSKYETWNSNMSDEELVDYYMTNNIIPANSNSNYPDRVILEHGVIDYLYKNVYTSYNWKISNNKAYVKDVYNKNPMNMTEENNDYIKEAKQKAGIDYEHVGCGPLAMLCQFDFLARNAGYVSIADNLENINDGSISGAPNFVGLATKIFKNTNTISSDSDIVKAFGIQPEEGTFTFPTEIIRSSKELINNSGLSIKKTRETVNSNGETKLEYYYEDSQLLVTGDTMPNLSSFSTKINNLKDSIDRGMPVIWWTLGGGKAEGYSNHYMNIYGYEYWTCVNSEGNNITRLMFILRANWDNNIYYYLDSELLNYVNGGFIYFEEVYEKTVIKPSDYNYECQYFYDKKENEITPYMGENLSTKYLRTGYVNQYDSTNTSVISQQISLSAKRENAGEAYIEYKFRKPVTSFSLEVCWWSSIEGITANDGKPTIEYKNHNGDWVTQLDLFNDVGVISKKINNKSLIRCKFDYPVCEFRIYIQTDFATGTRNKGRLVIGNMITSHQDFEHNYKYNSQGKSGHLRQCDCGYSSFEPHIVNASMTGSKYARCIMCGYLVDLNSDIAIGTFSLNKNYISENGSYILNNIIFLVEEDIESYLNGTLNLFLTV